MTVKNKNGPNLISHAPSNPTSEEHSQEQAYNNEEEQRVVHQVIISPAEPNKIGVRPAQATDPLLG